MIATVIGNGPDLALIHGWGLGGAVWEATLEALTQHCRVHLVDLPGYGDTPADQGGFVPTAQALIDALPPGVTLCGWSLGGMLALQAARLAPQRVARLILVGTTPSFTQHGDWAPAQPPDLLNTFSTAVNENVASTLQRFVALLNQGDARARAIIRALNSGVLGKPLPDTATLIKGLGWLRDVDLRAAMPAIAIPGLLVHGERDPLMPLGAAQWLAGRLPHARLEIFAATAHAPFLADPARFAALVSNFCHAPAAA